MSLWMILAIVAIAGGVGGVVNAFLTDNGFIIAKTVQVNGVRIVRPGFIGNIFISAVAAAISWGLYGPFNIAPIIGPPPPGTPPVIPSLTVAALVGAVLVGVAGARWLTNEVDKSLLKAAASQAASAPSSDPKAKQILLSSKPAEILNIAMRRDN